MNYDMEIARIDNEIESLQRLRFKLRTEQLKNYGRSFKRIYEFIEKRKDGDAFDMDIKPGKHEHTHRAAVAGRNRSKTSTTNKEI